MQRRHRHSGLYCLRRSIPRLYAPLSTLRRRPRGYLRMTRGRCGSLVLHRNGLAPSTSCRPSRRTAAQWLAYALPYRCFACTFTGTCARLGADAVRYSFIVADSHHLLLAGFTGAPHARVFDHAGSSERSRITRSSVSPSTYRTASAPEMMPLSRLDGWPMRSPVNASPVPSRLPAHDSGSMWFAIPSSWWTFTSYFLP